MKTDGPFYLNIPSQTLGAEGYNNSMPYAALCNVTLVSGGGGLIVITLTDDNGNEREYNLSSGNPVLIKKAYVQTIRLDGSGASVAGVLSWPDEVDPSSIAVSGPVSISGTVKTDVGQGSQIVGGTTLQYGGVAIDPRDIRPLVSTDVPGRAWALGSGDTLGGTPVTVGGAAIDPRDRNWALGSSDAPVDTAFTRSPAGTQFPPALDASGKFVIRNLGSTDNPDITANQSSQLGTNLKIDSVGLSKQAQLPANPINGSLATLSNSPAAFIFGDGSDGAVTFDGTSTYPFATLSGSIYYLTRDVQATEVHINYNIIVVSQNYRIYASESVVNIGQFSSDGEGGAGGAGGVSTGGAGTVGSNGLAAYGFQLGAGGGGGGGVAGEAGGNGGNGAGMVYIASPIVINYGIITAAGWAGGSTSNYGGGGGGGGGGVIFVLWMAYLDIGTVNTSGGAGGGSGSSLTTDSGYPGANGGYSTKGGISGATQTYGAAGTASVQPSTSATAGGSSSVSGGGGGGAGASATDIAGTQHPAQNGAAGGNGFVFTQQVVL